MSVEEFQTGGYLQEVNRLLLHRLGVALSVQVDDNGAVLFGPVIDCRDEPGGLIFANSVEKRIFQKRAKKINSEFIAKRKERMSILGYDIEPAL